MSDNITRTRTRITYVNLNHITNQNKDSFLFVTHLQQMQSSLTGKAGNSMGMSGYTPLAW